mmetsp:Transcript_154165/g.494164  ORF Transcript_154165/g.494164 Transcript_154165/m.494164 type:complete len:292 (-) Transcript_154165:2148-3023(-)
MAAGGVEVAAEAGSRGFGVEEQVELVSHEEVQVHENDLPELLQLEAPQLREDAAEPTFALHEEVGMHLHVLHLPDLPEVAQQLVSTDRAEVPGDEKNAALGAAMLLKGVAEQQRVGDDPLKRLQRLHGHLFALVAFVVRDLLDLRCAGDGRRFVAAAGVLDVGGEFVHPQRRHERIALPSPHLGELAQRGGRPDELDGDGSLALGIGTLRRPHDFLQREVEGEGRGAHDLKLAPMPDAQEELVAPETRAHQVQIAPDDPRTLEVLAHTCLLRFHEVARIEDELNWRVEAAA